MSSLLQGNAFWWGLCLTGAAAIATAAAYVIFGPESFRGKVSNCPGLVNLGNTCFINAVLQALSSIEPVLNWLEHYSTLSTNTLTQSLHKILYNLNTSNEQNISPTELLDALLHHGWLIDYQQQDALELYHVLLNTLDEEITRTSSTSSTSSLTDAIELFSTDTANVARTRQGSLPVPLRSKSSPFRGLLTSTLICCHCSNKLPTRCEYIDSISLPLQSNIYMTSIPLKECLRNYVTSEVVQDVDCPICSKQTTTKRQFIKQLRIGRLPDVLCISLMRAQWMPDGSLAKNTFHVQFPLSLDVDHFLTSSVLPSNPLQHGYQLKAVIEHLGGPSSGHYCTYKHCNNGQWVYTSDVTVYPVNVTEVLNAQAYMLFYQKNELKVS